MYYSLLIYINSIILSILNNHLLSMFQSQIIFIMLLFNLLNYWLSMDILSLCSQFILLLYIMHYLILKMLIIFCHYYHKLKIRMKFMVKLIMDLLPHLLYTLFSNSYLDSTYLQYLHSIHYLYNFNLKNKEQNLIKRYMSNLKSKNHLEILLSSYHPILSNSMVIY